MEVRAPTLSEAAEQLEGWARATGERAFARAASALRQQPPGRQAIDDSAALAEVAWLMSAKALTASRACDLVAGRLVQRGCESTVRSVSERLRAKRRKLQGIG